MNQMDFVMKLKVSLGSENEIASTDVHVYSTINDINHKTIDVS